MRLVTTEARAAEALSIKHTAFSRAIGQLEYVVGTSLFERSSGGIKPTLAGRAVLRIARLILEQVDMLVDTGRSGGRGDTGHLVIGFFTSMSTGNLRATIGELKKQLPRLELATMERSRFRLMTALRNGTADVVVIRVCEAYKCRVHSIVLRYGVMCRRERIPRTSQ
nr:LysR family transcriptional regulator [Bradyrhizobium jicamae]